MQYLLISFCLILFITPAVYSQSEDFHITDCGVLFDGVEAGCMMIDTYNHDDYLLLHYPDTLKAGDTVFVSGWVDAGCLSFCMQGDCLFVTSVSACPDITEMDECGVIIQGDEDECWLFDSFEHGIYEITNNHNYLSSSPGDTVYVGGDITYDCQHSCPESDGCLKIQIAYPCKYTKPVEVAGVIKWWLCTYLKSLDGLSYELIGDFSPFEIDDTVYIYAHYYMAPSTCMIGPILEIDSIFANAMTDIKDIIKPLPHNYELGNNHPNPFNLSTVINYSLAGNADASLSIYNVSGRRVKILVDEYQTVGNHSVIWDGTDDNNNIVATGVYFYKLETAEFVDCKKLILLK